MQYGARGDYGHMERHHRDNSKRVAAVTTPKF
jgi:hypothetical protein